MCLFYHLVTCPFRHYGSVLCIEIMSLLQPATRSNEKLAVTKGTPIPSMAQMMESIKFILDTLDIEIKADLS